jgi:radical SAM superfamily enzyme YgiQ (UPF0313 family)
MPTEHDARLRVAIVVPAKKYLCLGGVLWTQRYGPLQVASVAREAGFSVRVFNEELGERASAEELACNYDVIGFSAKSSAITRAEELAEDIKGIATSRGRTVVTVLGGEHASMCGGNRLSEHFDYVLPGESEEVFVLLLHTLDLDQGANAKSIRIPPPKPLYTCQSFDNIPDLSLVGGYEQTVNSFVFQHLPALWMLRHKRFPMLTFQAARGCPYKCSFCPTPRYLQGPEYRRRSYESGIAYLEDHMSKSGIRRVMFEDPNAAIPFDKDSYWFFDALARSSLGMKATALVRTEICRDQKLLEVMRAAGVENLSVGIESLSEQTRNDFKKRMSQESIVESIAVFHRLGFSVTGLFIVGYDSDDLDSLEQIERFIHQTGLEKWRVSPLTQMLELPDQFMPAHRFFLWDEFAPFGRETVDYGNGEFVLFYPKHLSPSYLQESIMRFNLASTSATSLMKLISKRRSLTPVLARMGYSLAQRMVQREILASDYIKIMRALEEPFYSTQNGRMSLREDLLEKRYRSKGERARSHTSLAGHDPER